MPPPTSDVRTEDDQLIVEAPTAEAALQLVAERLGTRARIANVERIRRGGVGGFFARELVQVTATGHGDAPGPATGDGPVFARDDDDVTREIVAPAPAVRRPAPEDAAPESALDSLLRTIADRDDPFATVLQRELGRDDGSAEPATPAPPPFVAAPTASTAPAPSSPHTPPTAATAPFRPRVSGTPEWSVDNLCRLGLPPLLSTAEAAGLAPTDDIGWTHALAERLAPLCGPAPEGPVAIVGPHAERFADPLGLPVGWPGQPPPPASFVVGMPDHRAGREWLAWVRGDRTLHVVAGGRGWRGLLFEKPALLSWVDDDGMCEAIGVAHQLDIMLGYACADGGVPVPANPVDLATAIRRLLPVHD